MSDDTYWVTLFHIGTNKNGVSWRKCCARPGKELTDHRHTFSLRFHGHEILIEATWV